MICQYYGNEKISTIKVNILFNRSYQSAHLYCKLFCIIPEVKNSIAYSHKDEKYATLHLHFNTHAGFNYGIEIEASFFSTLIVLLINVKK